MTGIFAGIHDAIENTFAKDIVYDPSGVNTTAKAVVEVGYKSTGGIDRIEIPIMLFFSQNELDDKSITLAQDDTIQIGSTNYTISEIEIDGRGGVIAAIQLAVV